MKDKDEEYKGTIVEESLVDNRIINNFKIISIKISADGSSSERWHLYKVKVSREEIKEISKNLKSTKWYAHFWKDKEVIAVFKDKIFTFNYDNKITWKSAIEYGLSIGIPREQLDFLIS